MSESVRHVFAPGQSDRREAPEKSPPLCADSSHDATHRMHWCKQDLASAPLTVQEAALAKVVRADPDLMAILHAVHKLDVPDCWLTAGAVYQTVWNVLTGMPNRHGIKDYDVCYFDAADISSESQSELGERIRELVRVLAGTDLNIEVVNQARVHLWFEEHFGFAVPPLESTAASLPRYACTHHAVAVQLSPRGELRSLHPFGLDDVFGMRIRPNRLLPNQETHRAKATRAQALWPGVIIEAW